MQSLSHMKSNVSFFILSIFLIALVGCKKQPTASFTVDNYSPFINDVIHFDNTSLEGITFTWDFGDGATSTEENPSHTYVNAGVYTVTLTAYSKKSKKADSYSTTITVLKTMFDKLTEKWNYNASTFKQYMNDSLYNTNTYNYEDAFTIHTVDFKDDLSYTVTLDATVNSGVWELNTAEKYIILNGTDTSHILNLTENELDIVSIAIYNDGTNVYTDSSFSHMAR